MGRPEDCWKPVALIALAIFLHILLMANVQVQSGWSCVLSHITFLLFAGDLLACSWLDPGTTASGELRFWANDSCCGLPQGAYKYHCPVCDACVLGHHHHCYYLNNCIGKRNRILFEQLPWLAVCYAAAAVLTVLIN